MKKVKLTLYTPSLVVVILLLAITFSMSALAERGVSRIESTGNSFSTPFANGKYRAIIIGNNQYEDITAVWKPLKTAISDAESVAKILKQDYGFSDVVLMRNATRRQILLALNDLRQRVKKEDSVLMYYAGHGYMDPSTDEAYWIPVDAQGWDDSFFLSNSRIKEKLSTVAKKAKHTLIVSDSCFSGTLLRGASSGNRPKVLNEPYYRKVAARRSVQIMAAGGEEFVDDNYKGSGHSPYTYFFINELKRNDQQYMTVSVLGSGLARLVANNVMQTPQYGVLYGAGDEGGEFLFNRTSLSTRSVKSSPHMAINIGTQGVADQMTIQLSFWESVKEMDDPRMYQAYLDKYPQGVFTAIATRRLEMSGGSKSEMDKISQVVGSIKQYLEEKNIRALENLGKIPSKRKQLMNSIFSQYNSFDAKITDFTHVSAKHKAKLTINLVNLVDTLGRRGTAKTWGKMKIEIRKNQMGQFRVYWK